MNIDKEIERIKKKTLPIFKKYPVKRAGVFGSTIRGEQRSNSDIDLLIEFNKQKDISYLEYFNLIQTLEEALSKKVDLVEYHLIKPALREFILPYEIRIYEENK